jgi:hypothetical protein
MKMIEPINIPVLNLENETDNVKEYMKYLEVFILRQDIAADLRQKNEFDEQFEDAAGMLEEIWFRKMSEQESDRVDELTLEWGKVNLHWYEPYPDAYKFYLDLIEEDKKKAS